METKIKLFDGTLIKIVPPKNQSPSDRAFTKKGLILSLELDGWEPKEILKLEGICAMNDLSK